MLPIYYLSSTSLINHNKSNPMHTFSPEFPEYVEINFKCNVMEFINRGSTNSVYFLHNLKYLNLKYNKGDSIRTKNNAKKE